MAWVSSLLLLHFLICDHLNSFSCRFRNWNWLRVLLFTPYVSMRVFSSFLDAWHVIYFHSLAPCMSFLLSKLGTGCVSLWALSQGSHPYLLSCSESVFLFSKVQSYRLFPNCTASTVSLLQRLEVYQLFFSIKIASFLDHHRFRAFFHPCVMAIVLPPVRRLGR